MEDLRNFTAVVPTGKEVLVETSNSNMKKTEAELAVLTEEVLLNKHKETLSRYKREFSENIDERMKNIALLCAEFNLDWDEINQDLLDGRDFYQKKLYWLSEAANRYVELRENQVKHKNKMDFVIFVFVVIFSIVNLLFLYQYFTVGESLVHVF